MFEFWGTKSFSVLKDDMFRPSTTMPSSGHTFINVTQFVKDWFVFRLRSCECSTRMNCCLNRKLTSLYCISDNRVPVTKVVLGYCLENFYPHGITLCCLNCDTRTNLRRLHLRSLHVCDVATKTI